MLATKFCPKCSTPKPLADFAKRTSAVDERQPWCKACTNTAHNDWYRRNGLAKREAQCDYYAQHADEINKRRREKRAAAKRGADHGDEEAADDLAGEGHPTPTGAASPTRTD
jgi:hypothetical protein